MPLSDQLKQLTELHRVVGLAMKDLIVQFWPAEPMPSSYFGPAKRLFNARPRIDATRGNKAHICSACIEGARMASARVKM